MKYCDGQEVRTGDKVRLGEDAGGIVVCSMDTNKYSDSYPESTWGYLKNGVMISFPLYGLIHYTEPEEDLELISRSAIIDQH